MPSNNHTSPKETRSDVQLDQDIGIAWRILGQRGIPQDYRAELCLRALNSINLHPAGHSATPSQTPVTAYGAALREIKRFRRKRMRHTRVPFELRGIEIPPDDRKQLQVLIDALDELPSAESDAFWLFQIEGLAPSNVGQLLNISESFARARLKSAQHRLRRSRFGMSPAFQDQTIFKYLRTWHGPTEEQFDHLRTTFANSKLASQSSVLPSWMYQTLAILVWCVALAGLWAYST